MSKYDSLTDFLALWNRLEDTRKQLYLERKLFCIRRVIQAWAGSTGTDDLIWEICNMAELCGFDPLPPPAHAPLASREFLRAWVAVTEGKGRFRVKLKLLDQAYSLVFPQSTPINVWKKKL